MNITYKTTKLHDQQKRPQNSLDVNDLVQVGRAHQEVTAFLQWLDEKSSDKSD